jgi:alpha-glucosidase (family GH31 glycosyl hydrolase)
MIGGNGYNGDPSAELIARWIQANTFMPTMQFSYLPWEITSDDVL